MIVLMKLRLNLGIQDIAFWLGICTATVSRHLLGLLYVLSFAVAYKMARNRNYGRPCLVVFRHVILRLINCFHRS